MYPNLPEPQKNTGVTFRFNWETSPANPASGFSDWQLEIAKQGWRVKAVCYYNGSTIPYDYVLIVPME